MGLYIHCRKIIVASILMLVHWSLYAQKSDSLGKAVYLEFLGKGFISINVDFSVGDNGRITTGLTLLDNEFKKKDPNDENYPTLTLPTPGVMYLQLFGRKKHFFEMGFGISISPVFWKKYSDNDSAITLHGCLGYRYQVNNGFFFRAGATPFYRVKWAFLPLAGISLGYGWP